MRDDSIHKGLIPHQRRVFLLIVAYRWFSLLIASLFIFIPQETAARLTFSPVAVFALAALLTVSITVFHKLLNRSVLERPWLLGVDLLFSTILLGVSGGVHSPYYLNALSPLLAGAFFFQLKGGFLTALIFTPLYLLAALSRSTPTETISVNVLLTQLAGIWIIPALFGYTSTLLKQLHQTNSQLREARDELEINNSELANTNERLKTIYDLTVMLQGAPEVSSVQRRVLQVITDELGMPGAVVGLVQPGKDAITNWLAIDNKGFSAPELPPLPLFNTSGALIQAMSQGSVLYHRNGQSFDDDRPLDDWLKQNTGILLPLIFHQRPIGVLMIANDNDSDELSEEQLASLRVVANQASVSLGTTILCVERAQELAVAQERNRIARDIHDTVSQSLFGFSFTLDACIQMLSADTAKVKQELIELKTLANEIRDQVRHSIFDLWPSTLTWEIFKSDIERYVSACYSLEPFIIDFRLEGDFNQLSPAIRRNLYRISQEALTNVVHHAGVNRAEVCLNITQDLVGLVIRDSGTGFDPEIVLAREHDREHFGLHGISERVRALDGECEVLSIPDGGTSILISLPLDGRIRYG